MKHLRASILILLIVGITIIACQNTKEQNNDDIKPITLVLPQTPYSYLTQSPSNGTVGWVDNNKATLGRVLFYDRILSINNTVSCATCHKQSLAFSDDKEFSIGFGDQRTTRNSMAIVNPISDNGFFWDLRESTLDSMVVKPVQNHIEMGFDNMDNVAKKISLVSYYPELFRKAFGSTEVTEATIQNAIGEFLRAMSSYNSKYDVGIASNFSNFTSEELLGKELLTQKLYCKHCHTGMDFRPPQSYTQAGGGGANIGLEMAYKDKGIKLSFNSGEGFFKIPSLRNIELTAPYMHDGRFKTLEEVIEHYNSGVQNHPNLSSELRMEETANGEFILHEEPVRLNLTEGEKKALVAFLKTLTDYKFVNDERFSNPFRVVN